MRQQQQQQRLLYLKKQSNTEIQSKEYLFLHCPAFFPRHLPLTHGTASLIGMHSATAWAAQ